MRTLPCETGPDVWSIPQIKSGVDRGVSGTLFSEYQTIDNLTFKQ